jgi:hypothetical protein
LHILHQDSCDHDGRDRKSQRCTIRPAILIKDDSIELFWVQNDVHLRPAS